MPDSSVDLYNNVYADFAGSVEAAVRQETYGEDLGQTSWLTAREWLEFAEQLGVGPSAEVLEVGSGSGGPAVYLALARGGRVMGVEINEHGVRNASGLAEARGLAGRVQFQAVDAGRPLPFSPGRFDAIVSNDAMCHIGDRLSVLRDWHRHREPLVAREGQANFDGLQRFLKCAHTLSVERRLSRYAYLAEKPPDREGS